MGREVWIAVVVMDRATERKIGEKHQVARHEVDEAIALGAASSTGWHDHPIYGRRLLARGRRVTGRELIVTLVPIDETDGVWECKTARKWSGP